MKLYAELDRSSWAVGVRVIDYTIYPIDESEGLPFRHFVWYIHLLCLVITIDCTRPRQDGPFSKGLKLLDNLKYVLALATVLLSGCGGMDASDCLFVWSKGSLDNDAAQENVVRARELLGYSKAAFCAEFLGMPVEVKTVSDWKYRGAQVCGTFDIVTGIVVGERMDCFVHELFHAIDAHRFGLTTGAHVNWEEMGRNALDSEYDKGSVRLVAR